MSWSVRESQFRSEVEESEGRITFANGVQQQDLVIRLKNDVVSTFSWSLFNFYCSHQLTKGVSKTEPSRE